MTLSNTQKSYHPERKQSKPKQGIIPCRADDGNIAPDDGKPNKRKEEKTMARSEKSFKNYVNAIRLIMPEYSNGRKVIVLREDTKKGQDIIERASRYEGYTLEQVYTTPSDAKRQAFEEAWEMYRNSRHGDSFGICSHNCQMFTVSWLSDDGLTFLTPTREYLVIFNE